MNEAGAGHTRLEPEEQEGLIPDIQTQAELNEWEQNNILEGERWLFPTRRELGGVLTTEFLRKLHRKMFGHVWEWAGEFRRSEKNIGIDPQKISVESYKLCENVSYWIENETYDRFECLARLHHKLTVIHHFPNGNGRHARLYTDYVSYCWRGDRLAWGGQDLEARSNTRDSYIECLRAADKGNIQPLVEFIQD